MNYSSVLFSRNHLLNPFSIECKRKEISLADKKIKAIALSVIVGIFTAGIGGIIFFYCLTAKYKVEKINIAFGGSYGNNTLHRKQEPPLPRPVFKSEKSNPVKPNNSLDSKDREFIYDFVAAFLHRYISGFITKETDAKDRKPMIELLKEAMPGFDPTRNDEVEEIALNAFFEKATMGLYVNQQWGNRNDDITSKSPQFTVLVDALAEALPREFPDKSVSTSDLRKRASEALSTVNKQRRQARQDALNYTVSGGLDRRSAKLRQLQKSDRIFL